MNIAIGGSTKNKTMAVSHMFLSDSAYARRAEKAARNRCYLTYGHCEKELRLTSDCEQTQYLGRVLGPSVCCATTIREQL